MEEMHKLFAEQVVSMGPTLCSSLIILLAFWLASQIVSMMIKKAGERVDFDKSVVALLARSAKVALMIFGCMTALGTLGVDVSALVAGLGLTGFALGFALKDTISNLLAGILILLYTPFETGDRIRLGAFEGTVECINLRYTELHGDGNRILVPNSKLFTDPIVVLVPVEQDKCIPTEEVV